MDIDDQESKYIKRKNKSRNKIIVGLLIVGAVIIFCVFNWSKPQPTTSTNDINSYNSPIQQPHDQHQEENQDNQNNYNQIKSPGDNSSPLENGIPKMIIDDNTNEITYDMWKSVYSYHNYGFWRTYISTTCH